MELLKGRKVGYLLFFVSNKSEKMEAAHFPSWTKRREANSEHLENPQECGCREPTREIMASIWWRWW